MATEAVLGIDIGGTNTVFGLVDQEGVLLAEGSVTSRGYPGAEAYVTSVCGTLKELLAAHAGTVALKGIGLGAPNGNYYHGTIEFAPNLEWRGVIPIAALFAQGIGVPAVLTNDANAAAIGEMLFGAARGMKDFIVMTLGTGVGSGIVVNGELVYGHDGFAGEIGHTLVDPKGRECKCGRRGCLETYTSAGGLVRTVMELLADSNAESALRSISMADMTAAMVAEAAGRGDVIALRAFEATGRILGLKLADAVAHTSPEAIFLFGGLANAGPLLFTPTQAAMEEYMLNIFKNKVRLLPSGLRDKNVAVLGAAALMWKELQKQ